MSRPKPIFQVCFCLLLAFLNVVSPPASAKGTPVPASVEPKIKQAIAEFQANHPEEAIRILSEELDALNVEKVAERRAVGTYLEITYSRWGYALEKNGEYDKALVCYQNALNLTKIYDPDQLALNNYTLGSFLAYRKRQSEALPYLEAGLTTARGTKAELPILTCLGLTQAALGLDAQAERTDTEALKLAKTRSDAQSAAQINFNIALLKNSQQKYGAAKAACELALPYFEKHPNVCSVSSCLLILGQATFGLNEFDEALKYANNAIRTSQDDGDLGASWALAGKILTRTQRWDPALDAFTRAYGAATRFKRADYESLALYLRAGVYQLMGRLVDALTDVKESLRLAGTIANPTLKMKVAAPEFLMVAQIWANMGSAENALPLLRTARDMFQKIGDRSGGIAKTFAVEGFIRCEQSRFNEASNAALLAQKALVGNSDDFGARSAILSIDFQTNLSSGNYDKALQICSKIKILGEQEELLEKVVDAETYEALVWATVGQHSKALSIDNQALSHARRSKSIAREATLLSNIGMILSSQGDNRGALVKYDAAAKILLKLNLRRDLGILQTNRGVTLQALGRPAEARGAFNDARSFARDVGDRRTEAAALGILGRLNLRFDRFEDATIFQNEAQMIATQIGASNLEAAILGNQMQLYQDPKNPHRNKALAIFYGKQCLRANQRQRGFLRKQDRDIQKQFSFSVDFSYRMLAGLLVEQNRPAEALSVIDLWKEEEYLNYGGKVADLLSDKVPETDIERIWGAKLIEQNKKVDEAVVASRDQLDMVTDFRKQSAGVKEAQGKVDVERQAYFKLVSDMGESFASGSGKAISSTVQLEALQNTLSRLEHASAIYSFVSERQLHLLLVTPTSITAAAPSALTEAALKDKVANCVNAIKFQYPTYKQDSKVVYDYLFKPFASELSKTTHILLALDGILKAIPVAALWDGQRYVVEKWTTSFFTPASSGTLTRSGRPHGSMLLAGTQDNFPGVQSSDLNGVGTELQKIGQLGKSTILLDKAFTPAAWDKALLKRPSVVHLATHFKWDGKDGSSFLLMGNGKVLTLNEFKKMRSDLFFGVDVLTLAACQTAGQSLLHVDDIENLSVLAQRKGASAVVASLWSVDNDATSALMSSFYKLLRSRPDLSKAEALRLAEVSLLRSPTKNKMWSQPYFWAPFVLTGNTQ